MLLLSLKIFTQKHKNKQDIMYTNIHLSINKVKLHTVSLGVVGEVHSGSSLFWALPFPFVPSSSLVFLALFGIVSLWFSSLLSLSLLFSSPLFNMGIKTEKMKKKCHTVRKSTKYG